MIATLLILLAIVGPVEPISFLFVPMSHIASHAKSMLPFAERLIQVGHHVEIIWGGYQPKSKLNKKGIAETFIELEPPQDPKLRDIAVFENDTDFHRQIQGVSHPIHDTHHIIAWVLGMVIVKDMSNTGEIDRFIADRNDDFDVVVIDTHFAPLGFLLAEKLKLPHIMLATTYVLTNTLAARGLPQPVASYPHVGYSPHNHLKYKWRLFGTYSRALSELAYAGIDLNTWYRLWQMDPEFGHFSVRHFEKNSLAVVSVASQQLDFPHPHLKDVHYIDSHCPPVESKPLKDGFEAFVSDPESKGTIIIAFGHMIRWKYAPPRWLAAMLGAAELLPQYRFVLQYDADQIEVPANVLVSAWLPQKDLLLHPKTVGFVSHMGYKSYLEAICSKVPIIAFPIFAEQPRNSLVAEMYLRVAETVHKASVTPAKLASSIERVVSNSEYKENTAKISRFIQDQLIDPLDLAVFKMEHAYRHRNDMALFRSKGAELCSPVYFSLDVISLFLVFCFVALYVSMRLVKRKFC